MIEVSSELLATGIVSSLLAVALFLLYYNMKIRESRLRAEIDELKEKVEKVSKKSDNDWK